MPTARGLIRSSLRLLGVLATGEQPAAQEAQDGLEALNAFLDSASLERLTAYTIERLDVPLVPGKRTYTWGVPGGDIATPRPLQVEGAVLRLVENDYEYPLELVDQAGYQGVALKAEESLYPSLVWYEPTYPLGQLHLWTVPEQANVLAVFPWVPLTRFPSLDGELNMPPGYQRWLTYALACELAPEYGKEPTPTIVATLASAISAIKRVNSVVPTLGMDPAFSGRQAGGWDARSGGYLWRR